jgi:hypothetical protein
MATAMFRNPLKNRAGGASYALEILRRKKIEYRVALSGSEFSGKKLDGACGGGDYSTAPAMDRDRGGGRARARR